MTTDQRITALMVAMTFSTGVVDGASYLGLHRVFTANMTGNVVFLGLGVVGHNDLPVVRSLLALGGFLLGALCGGRAQRDSDPALRCPPRTVVVFFAVAALLAALTVTFAAWTPGPSALDALTVAFGLAMGAQASAARRLAVTDVSTVVVTSTLAALAADSRLGTGTRQRQLRRLLAGLAIGVGAVLGGLLLKITIAVPLGVAAAVSITVAAILHAESGQDRVGRATPSS